jgi:ubiquinone/menaquinone biosynthesis C-methylase UbiE
VFRSIWFSLLRFGFRLLYHEMAFTYDWVANVVSLGQWWDWQRAALPYLPPPGEGLILELAHGTGSLQVDLAGGGWRVIGYDLSPQMGRLAQKRLRKAGLPVRLIRGRAQELPFAAQSFAGIVSTFPTPFIVEDDTLAEVYRVLEPGRRLVFVPAGILKQKGTAETLLEGAFRITGQRDGWGVDWQAHFAGHGFQVSLHSVDLEGSVVHVVVAEKD